MDKIWEYNDGGRFKAGFVGNAGDCVVRNMQRVKETMLQSIYKKEEVLLEMVFTNKFSDLILKVWALSLCQLWASALAVKCI